jgi:hypothetical protein
MTVQNEKPFNEKEFNSFFAPKGSIVAKQVATKEQLVKQQSEIANINAGGSGKTGLLVQNSLSETPTQIAQKNVANINVQTAEKRSYRELFYCMSKVVNYMRMHVNNQFSPNGDFIQSVINNPKNQAIRSRTNTAKDLGLLYDMQFYLNTGPIGNSFLEEISEPLPGSVGKIEFSKRLDPAAAESETLRSLARLGFVDTDFNPLSADTIPVAATRVSLTIRDITPLESACKGRNA